MFPMTNPLIHSPTILDIPDFGKSPAPTDDSGSFRVKTPSRQEREGKQGSNGLMHKMFVFGKQVAAAGEHKLFEMRVFRGDVVELPEEVIQDRARSNELRRLVVPCPFIRPLEHKLQPRLEQIRLPSRGATLLSQNFTSAIAIAQKGVQADRRLIAKSSDTSLMAVLADHTAASNQVNISQYQMSQSSDLQDQQIEDIALSASPDAGITKHWRHWLFSYSTGQFNVHNPPIEPPRKPTFRYLPAIYPNGESDRMRVYRQYDIVWRQWNLDKAGALLMAAMKRFDASCASISFFDENYEVFKLESGYNKLRIDRATSIAAHALLSTDVFVVFDTKQDWRFEGNPLVEEDPKIRFFAGALMLSPDGEAVGVFAVFGQNPRECFGHKQRRELAEFSSLIMNDLNLQIDWLSDPDLRSTPLLQRESVINGEYRPGSIEAPSAEINSRVTESDPALSALRYHKDISPPKRKTRLYLNNRKSKDIFSSPSEQTPPSSGESDDEAVFESPKYFGKNHKSLSLNSGVADAPSHHDMLTPDSLGSRASTPRPFSSSDITSLNPHPPNTPVHSLMLGRETKQPELDFGRLAVDNFLSMSDKDYLENPENSTPFNSKPIDTTPSKHGIFAGAISSGSLVDVSSPTPKPKAQRRPSDQSVSPSPMTKAPRRTTRQSVGSVAPPISRMTRSSQTPSIMSLRTPEASEHLAEAAFACAFTAKSYSYDLIYVAEIKPAHRRMTDKELLEEGGLQKQILVAYGLTEPIDLNSKVHLKVLRCRSCEVWENKLGHDRKRYDEGEYRWGCMIPIFSEGGPGQKRYRNSGIVVGFFQLASRAKEDAFGEVQKTSADLKKLEDAAKSLKSILIKPKPAANSSIIRKPPTAFPVPPKRAPTPPNRYPANEAVELKFGKMSLDTNPSGAVSPATKTRYQKIQDVRKSVQRQSDLMGF